MMRGIGIDDRITWLPMDQSGFDRIIAPGFELATPVGWDAYEANLIDAFPGERKSVRRFHRLMRQIGEAHDRNDMVTAGGLARWAGRAGRAAAFMGLPYGATLAALGLSPRMAYALSVQSGAVACSPTVLPTAAMAAILPGLRRHRVLLPQGRGTDPGRRVRRGDHRPRRSDPHPQRGLGNPARQRPRPRCPVGRRRSLFLGDGGLQCRHHQDLHRSGWLGKTSAILSAPRHRLEDVAALNQRILRGADRPRRPAQQQLLRHPGLGPGQVVREHGSVRAKHPQRQRIQRRI